jgi:hypothetical protein
MTAPDSTAVRVALWRALHLLADPAPHVLPDEIGLRLAAPPEDWRQRPDMDLTFTARVRASVVARARFTEDAVAASGAEQHVLLGAGLDSYAQRVPGVRVFEVDQPETVEWKRRRLTELGLPRPEQVPVDFERDESWLEALIAAGFDPGRRPATVQRGVTPGGPHLGAVPRRSSRDRAVVRDRRMDLEQGFTGVLHAEHVLADDLTGAPRFGPGQLEGDRHDAVLVFGAGHSAQKQTGMALLLGVRLRVALEGGTELRRPGQELTRRRVAPHPLAQRVHEADQLPLLGRQDQCLTISPSRRR